MGDRGRGGGGGGGLVGDDSVGGWGWRSGGGRAVGDVCHDIGGIGEGYLLGCGGRRGASLWEGLHHTEGERGVGLVRSRYDHVLLSGALYHEGGLSGGYVPLLGGPNDVVASPTLHFGRGDLYGCVSGESDWGERNDGELWGGGGDTGGEGRGDGEEVGRGGEWRGGR